MLELFPRKTGSLLSSNTKSTSFCVFAKFLHLIVVCTRGWHQLGCPGSAGRGATHPRVCCKGFRPETRTKIWVPTDAQNWSMTIFNHPFLGVLVHNLKRFTYVFWMMISPSHSWNSKVCGNACFAWASSYHGHRRCMVVQTVGREAGLSFVADCLCTWRAVKVWGCQSMDLCTHNMIKDHDSILQIVFTDVCWLAIQ